jgi:endo-1,4-beta-xylanase
MAKNRIRIKRRSFLLGLGALAGVGAFAISSRARQVNDQPQTTQAQITNVKNKNFAVTGEAPLRLRAKNKGLIYGASGRYSDLFQNSLYKARFAQECGMLVPGLELKWQVLRPTLDRFDFTKGDRMAEFARSHNMLFRGTALAWHEALPGWFKNKVDRKNAEQVMVKHIKTVAGHYAGKMHSWDVVNEAIRVADKRSDGLRKSPWLKLLGPDYIEIAFRTAAEADPKALLVYNDHQLEYSKFENEVKRTKVLELLERLKSKGVPLHALGMQAHVGVDANKHLNPQKLRDFLKDVASLGLKIMITELDVSEQQNLDVDTRDQVIAGVYEDFLSVMLDEPAVTTVITWGLSDRYTWLSKRPKTAHIKGLRPLPLDAQMERKLAWNAIAQAFDNAPMRKVEYEGDGAFT